MNMNKIIKHIFLYRIETSDQGTKGLWVAPGFFAKILELPWRDNKQNISCISEGEYLCRFRISKKFGAVYHITDVEGRTWILTHAGNLAGDRDEGYETHSYGCILMGKYFGFLRGQVAVLLSRITLRKFVRKMNKEDFMLHVIKTY